MPSTKKQGKRKHEGDQETGEINITPKNAKRRTRSNTNNQEKLDKYSYMKEGEENSGVTDCETQPPSHSCCLGAISASKGSFENVPSILSLPCVDEKADHDTATDSFCNNESVSESAHETNTESDKTEKDDFNSKEPQRLTKDLESRQSNVALEIEEDSDSMSLLKPFAAHDVSSFCQNKSDSPVDNKDTGNETNGICKESNPDNAIENMHIENGHPINIGHRGNGKGERVQSTNRKLYEIFNNTEISSVDSVSDTDKSPLKNVLRENGPTAGVTGESKESNQSYCHQSVNNSNSNEVLAICHHKMGKEEGLCVSVTETITLGDQDEGKRKPAGVLAQDQPNIEIPSLANSVDENVLNNINNQQSIKDDGGDPQRKGQGEEEWNHSDNGHQTEKANKTQDGIVRECINRFHKDERDIAFETTSTGNVDNRIRPNTLAMETGISRRDLKQQTTALEEDIVQKSKNAKTLSSGEVNLSSQNQNLVFSELSRSRAKTRSNTNEYESAYHREVDSSINGNLTSDRRTFTTPAVFHQDSERPKDLTGHKDTKTVIIPNLSDKENPGCGISIQQEDAKPQASSSQTTIKTRILSQDSVVESVSISSPKQTYSVGCKHDFNGSSPTTVRPQAMTPHSSNLIQQQWEHSAIKTKDGFIIHAKDTNLFQSTQNQIRTEKPDVIISSEHDQCTAETMKENDDRTVEVKPMENSHERYYTNKRTDGCQALKINSESLNDHDKSSTNSVNQIKRFSEINERQVVKSIVTPNQLSHEERQREYNTEPINKPTVNNVNGCEKKCCSHGLYDDCYRPDKLDKVNREDDDNNVCVSNLPKNDSPKTRKTSPDTPTSTNTVFDVKCDSLQGHQYENPGRTAMEENKNSLGTDDALLFDIFQTPDDLKSRNDTIGFSWEKDTEIDNRNIIFDDDVNKNNADTGMMNTNDNNLDFGKNTHQSYAGIDTIKNILTNKNQSVLYAGNTKTNNADDKEISNSSTYVSASVVNDKLPPTTASKQLCNITDDEGADDSMMMTDSQLCQVSNEIEMEADFDERQKEARRYMERKREEGKSLVRVVLNELGNVNRQLLRLKREMDMTKRKMFAGTTPQQNSLQQPLPRKQQQQITRQPQKQQRQQQQQVTTMFKKMSNNFNGKKS